MSNFFLYGDSQNPIIIYGKYDRGQLPREFTELFTGDSGNYLNFQARSHEFWFNTDIKFIPHGGSPVFTTDVQGNVTHEGNLLTKKDITVNGSSIFTGPATFNNQVTIQGNVLTRQDVRITRDLYVEGRIFSPQIEQLNARIKTLEDAK